MQMPQKNQRETRVGLNPRTRLLCPRQAEELRGSAETARRLREERSQARAAAREAQAQLEQLRVERKV